MDYGISPKEKKKRGERRRRKWREGVCERRMLCDAAAGWFWPSKEEGGLQSRLAREATPDPLHAPPCSRCKPSLLVTHTHILTSTFFFSHSARTNRGNSVWNDLHLHPICSIFLLAFFWGQSSKPAYLGGGAAVEVIWKLISSKTIFHCCLSEKNIKI